MTPQTFSLEMCRHLSSLVPGLEGHYDYYETANGEIVVVCRPEFHLAETIGRTYGEKICPAWQVEDVLRNWTEITVKVPTLVMSWHEKISWLLVSYPDTAYQKIEEYLWSVLK